MPVYVGLDAGGTKTRLRAVDASGQMLYEATSGPANLATTPDEAWRSALAELAAQCPRADYVAGCFAGLLTRADEDRAVGELQHLFPGAKVGAWPDYAATVAAAPEGTTAVVIAGTGSVIASMVEGKIVKSGGGGPLLWDLGSGYDIGKKCLTALVIEAIPSDASAATWQAIQDVFGSRLPSEVIAAVYRHPTPAMAIAQLAPFLVADADSGKFSYATNALFWVMDELATAVQYHIGTVLPNCKEWKVLLAGGVWNISPITKKYFDDNIETYVGCPQCNEITTSVLDLDPVDGAVILARRLAMPQTP